MAKADLPNKGDLRRDRRPHGSPKRVWSPGDFISYGIVVLLVGGFVAGVLMAAEPSLGIAALAIVGLAGSALFWIGVIAKGVSLGIRDVELRKAPPRPGGRVLTDQDLPPSGTD